MLSRRRFCLGAIGAAAGIVGGCQRSSEPAAAHDGRLQSRPGTPTGSTEPGLHALQQPRGTWLRVPAGYDAARQWPLALFFRGAITPAKVYLDAFAPLADAAGIVLLAPEPLGRTWDLVSGRFGPDAGVVDTALAEAFARVHVDPARVSVSGFSDGGSYALSLGVTNGDLLTRVAAYSPGFMAAEARRGQPDFFVAHGTRDDVLPINSTSRPIVAQLRALGYDVDFREFDGGHGVVLSLARESLLWMAGTRSSTGQSSPRPTR